MAASTFKRERESYMENSRKNLPWLLWLQIKFAPWLKRWRILRLKFGSKKVYPSRFYPEITSNLEAGAEHFQKHGWAFIEDIFNKDFYNELVANWPKKKHLEPPRLFAKSYNAGFEWKYGQKNNFSYFDPYGQYPNLVKLLDYFRSPELAARVTKFANNKHDLKFHYCVLTDAGAGSEVYPHKDGNQDDPNIKYNLNFIFFINAAGGKNSGNLTLSRDNELKDIIFEPKNLKNTCLIYDILGDFYHGFPPIAKGKFRWMISIQFLDKNYVEKHL